MDDLFPALRRAGIEIIFLKGVAYARQGVHQAAVTFVGDHVRSGIVRRDAQARALAALVKLKVVNQQMQRPPPPDSRPQRCHAKPRGLDMVCRYCKAKWPALDATYPPCQGDR